MNIKQRPFYNGMHGLQNSSLFTNTICSFSNKFMLFNFHISSLVLYEHFEEFCMTACLLLLSCLRLLSK